MTLLYQHTKELLLVGLVWLTLVDSGCDCDSLNPRPSRTILAVRVRIVGFGRLGRIPIGLSLLLGVKVLRIAEGPDSTLHLNRLLTTYATQNHPGLRHASSSPRCCFGYMPASIPDLNMASSVIKDLGPPNWFERLLT